MPKPKGTCGATKQPHMPVHYNKEQHGQETSGHNIWHNPNTEFYTYLNDNDIRNVYHHLNDLCTLGYIQKCPEGSDDIKQCYRITQSGVNIEEKFRPFVEILMNNLS